MTQTVAYFTVAFKNVTNYMLIVDQTCVSLIFFPERFYTRTHMRKTSISYNQMCLPMIRDVI